MKKVFTIGLMLLIVGVVGQVVAAPVFVYDGGIGTWSDVNKTSVTGNPDSLMCWIAAASNVLDWTEWTGWDDLTSSEISDATDIYAVFNGGWSNQIGAPTYAYEWWMTDRTESILEDPPGTSAKTFDSQGKNFYPGVNVQEGAGSVTAFVKEDASGDTIHTWLNNYINDDRGIVASIDVPDGPGGSSAGTYAHSVTIWGWDDATNQIWLTDSDDGLEALKMYLFTERSDGMWIEGYENLYTEATSVFISQLTRLNRNDQGIPPFHENGGTKPVVPEPATLLLMATGLIGLAGFKKKFVK